VVTSRLSAVPFGARRRLAATLGGVAALFAAIGAAALTGAGPVSVVFAVLGFVFAGLLALTAWGAWRSVTIDAADQDLDRVLEAAVAASGASMCSCGHEHDPSELHVTDACAHDGSGAACAHDCDTCVLAALRAN
jgi:hypothetical protein